MAKILAVVLMLLGGLLAFRGFTIWNSCGYDCAVFVAWSGLTATSAMLVGLLVFGSSAVALLVMLVGRLRSNGHQP